MRLPPSAERAYSLLHLLDRGGNLVGGAAYSKLDMAANAVYMTAARIGPLSIVVTLASLYPASTVLLARVILHEHLSRAQIAGIICALCAVVLIVSQGAA